MPARAPAPRVDIDEVTIAVMQLLDLDEGLDALIRNRKSALEMGLPDRQVAIDDIEHAVKGARQRLDVVERYANYEKERHGWE
jgi:L-fucose mutarotase/ribose pyranase (RbsD/FucU family)